MKKEAVKLAMVAIPVLVAPLSVNAMDMRTIEAIAEYRKESVPEAMERVNYEEHFSELDSSLQQFLGDDYAGSWLSSNARSLTVATSNENSLRWIRLVGAVPKLVRFSKSELARSKDDYAEILRKSDAGSRGTVDYFDPRNNKWVIEVISDSTLPVDVRYSTFFDRARERGVIIKSRQDIPRAFSTRRGGDEYFNIDRQSFCTSGFNLEEGFTVAAHCTDNDDEILYVGETLGTVEFNDFPNSDRAYVGQIQDGWEFVPEVNGYSGADKSVHGLTPASVGSTVCAYGSKTGGPNCGALLSRSVSASLDFGSRGTHVMTNLLEADSCGEPGDSGAPLITAAGQAQGMQIGGTKFQTCPDQPGTVTWYEPIVPAMLDMGTTLLTSSGATSPYVLYFRCPDYGNSGQGMFYCSTSYYTQGSTSVSWSITNGSGTGTDFGYFGSCAVGQPVSLSMTISNASGTITRNASFPCPGGYLP